jgi:2-amino-4-hydroxy-6-hydroxymethyldihydropteridine diphosphokinase
MNGTTAWVEAYVGLGSNLNDPMGQIEAAIGEIGKLNGVEAMAVSPLYASQPVGPQDQPDYVNAVMRIKTRLEALDLLKQLQQIENRHGRVRLERWGARTLDLDILLYDDRQMDLADLVVPHPELPNRAFVLYPLADVAPADMVVPGKGHLADLLAACPILGLKKMSAA